MLTSHRIFFLSSNPYSFPSSSSFIFIKRIFLSGILILFLFILTACNIQIKDTAAIDVNLETPEDKNIQKSSPTQFTDDSHQDGDFKGGGLNLNSDSSVESLQEDLENLNTELPLDVGFEDLE